MTTPLPYETSGNKSSKQLLVFQHRWPDTTAIWDNIIPPLQQNHYILNISYPNYSAKEKNPWGITPDETIKRLKVTIDQVNDTNRGIILVGHDWGVFYAYFLDYKHPKYVEEIIALDVGAMVPIKNPFFVAFLLCYQLVLITAFLVGGMIGRWITKIVMTLFMYRPPWMNRVDASWNYPYYQLWRMLLMNKFRVMPDYKPSCNVVFVSGDKKPLKIYNEDWVRLLKQNPRNEIHNEKFVHWIQIEMPEYLISLIKRRTTLLLTQSNK